MEVSIYAKLKDWSSIKWTSTVIIVGHLRKLTKHSSHELPLNE